MKATKVKTTQTIKDSQKGDVIVHKGKFILIPIDQKKDPFGSGPPNYFIISETEEIEVGDKVLTSYGKILIVTHKFDTGYNVTEINWYKENPNKGEYWLANKDIRGKILALPENFSPKHLQAIVDGKLKDDMECFIECENTTNADWLENGASPTLPFKIKLSLQNHITLHKVEEKMYSWEEVEDLLDQQACRTADQLMKTKTISPEIIKNIIKYCEDNQIYDKLSNYGDFYYKLKNNSK